MTDKTGLTFQECVHRGQQSQPGVQELIWVLESLSKSESACCGAVGL